MGCVNGRWVCSEESGLGREEEEGIKKKGREKGDGLVEERAVGSHWSWQGKDRT